MKKFVIAPALAVLLIVPLWAALGVLEVEEEEGGGHHGAGGGDVEEFIMQVEDFVAENTRPDGCVEPGLAGEGEHEGAEEHQEDEEHHEEHPTVYLQAFQYGYRPSKLCLKSGETYVFKMMSTDVTHGASIQLGPGSKMIRLPPGVLVEQEVTFTEPGEYMLYCSYYCGVGHPVMAAKIIVEPSEHEEEADHEEEAEHGGE
jgi:heme/copper-type cytochrome/quinol oxidase subunit 2